MGGGGKSPVTCHLSSTQAATAIDPPLVKSPNMHSVLIYKDRKFLSRGARLFRQKLKKSFRTRNMFFDQKYPLHVVPVPGWFPKQTDATMVIATYRLNQPRGWCSENTNQKLNLCQKICHPRWETMILVCSSFFGSCVMLWGPPPWILKLVGLLTNPISFACLVNLQNFALSTNG